MSQCAHADILEGYPDHDSWSGYFFYSKGHLRGVALIMLNFYCFFADVRVNKKAESADLYDDFVWDTNTLLYECGYVQLYWRNPFDWLIGHCATATSPLDRLRGLIDAYYLRGTDSSAE